MISKKNVLIIKIKWRKSFDKVFQARKSCKDVDIYNL